jgi:hypothetical protein
MSHYMRNILGLAACGVILIAASAQPAGAAQGGAPARPAIPSAQPGAFARPGMPSAQHGGPARPAMPSAPVGPNLQPPTRPTVFPQHNGTRPGSDWWRIYPWSPYNAWRNPYWYPPYNYNYPFPPDAGYPYNPYVIPQPYPVPPVPSPWGSIGSE